MSTHQNFFEKYNTFFAIIIAGILIAGAIFLSGITRQKPQPTPSQPSEKTTVDTAITKKFIAGDRIVMGNKESKNIVIEISDPSCPYCHFAAGLNPELVKKSGQDQFITVNNGGNYVAPLPELEKLARSGDIAFVYAYGNGHGNGTLAAEALYCGYERDAFWEVHDKLMTNEGYELMNTTVKNDRTKSSEFAKFLSNAIDEGYMNECLSSAKYESRVKRDASENSQLNFAGTPHFVVNGNIVRGAVDFSAIKGFIK